MNRKLLEALIQFYQLTNDKTKWTAMLRGMSAVDQDHLISIRNQITYHLIEEGHVG